MKSKNKSDNANRDPITGEPGSHPVGTGAGALAGGAAGAAVGAAAGPIGAGVGPAAGAVVGGLGGKAAGEHFNPTHAADLGRYIDYTVVDSRGDKIGTVDAVWEDHTGQPSYLAIRTGWLGLGKAHVVPAQSAEVNPSRQRIRLPYDADAVKGAPSFDSQHDITADSERSIGDYFGPHGYKYQDRNQSAYVDEPRRTDIAGTERRTNEDEAQMRLKQEEVKIGKRQVEYSGVRLRKIIRTETVNKPIELQREEIVVERTPVHDTAVPGGDANLDEEEIYIPLRREEPVVEKTVKATEEIRVGKRTHTDRQDVSETFRKEEVEIEEQAGTKNRGGTKH